MNFATSNMNFAAYLMAHAATSFNQALHFERVERSGKDLKFVFTDPHGYGERMLAMFNRNGRVHVLDFAAARKRLLLEIKELPAMSQAPLTPEFWKA